MTCATHKWVSHRQEGVACNRRCVICGELAVKLGAISPTGPAKSPNVFHLGSKGWAAMPRFRLEGSDPIEYFFAARFRKMPQAWILWSPENNDWSLMSDDLFRRDFVASNFEARRLLKSYANQEEVVV